MTNLWHTAKYVSVPFVWVRSQDFGVGLVDKKLLGFACDAWKKFQTYSNGGAKWIKMVITMVKSCKIRKTKPTKQIQGCQKTPLS